MKDHIAPILEELRKTKEELETLRASNTIKQANIERLEYENEKLEDKLQEQLCTVGSLLEENAKLIAERKEYLVNKVFESSDKKLLANHGFTDFIELLAAYEKLIAEREAMMKQEPVFYATKNLNIVITAETYNCGTAIGQADYPVPLYAHPLPAQQIPEGYDFIRQALEISNTCLVCVDKGYLLYGWDESRNKSMGLLRAFWKVGDFMGWINQTLSASQPKGDV